MRFSRVGFTAIVMAIAALTADVESRGQEQRPSSGDQMLQVILLGTSGGPVITAGRIGISTLVVAGSERLLFDAGRSSTTGLARLAIDPVAISRIFLTHLHSDHIISLPELLLFPWTAGRTTPLSVWGPAGTRAMMQKLQEAFTVDIHARRDEEAKFSVEGIQVRAYDISEDVVYESNGVKVTAFRVDHGPGVPAFAYRVDFRGRSVAISGDTKPTENLVKFASGVDVLIHEFGSRKDNPILTGSLDEVLPNGHTRRQERAIVELHTDGTELGKVFNRVKPKLAVFSHYAPERKGEVSLVRENYSGPLEFGEDLMTIDIGNQVNVRRFVPPGR